MVSKTQYQIKMHKLAWLMWEDNPNNIPYEVHTPDGKYIVYYSEVVAWGIKNPSPFCMTLANLIYKQLKQKNALDFE